VDSLGGQERSSLGYSKATKAAWPKEPVLRENLLQLKLKLKRRAVPASIRAFFSSPLGLLVEAPVLPKSLQ
jgi:hypothetical protein